MAISSKRHSRLFPNASPSIPEKEIRYVTKRPPHLAGLPGGIERPVWKKVHGTWRPLYGNFAKYGLSIEWHDFHVVEALAWSDSFHPNSLEICLNYAGEAELHLGKRKENLGREQIALYATRDELTFAVRKAESFHRFVTLEMSAEYLRRQFSEVLDALLPGVRRFLEDPRGFAPWVETRTLPSSLLGMRFHLIEPPVHARAKDTWYQGKVLEILAQTLFREDKPAELFCQRHKRLNRERVERVKFVIERDLENPPGLDLLAREVNCSSFYLSRLFAEEAGLSIPKYLRLKRLEKAADLIAQEGKSVTEAAMAVGYSSLSAFSKAFLAHFGVSPGKMSP